MDIKDMRQNTITQISTMKALKDGCFDGVTDIKTLKYFGNTGIGTFEGAEGEMIMYGGTVYKALYTDKITEAGDNETVPYALAAFSDNGTDLKISDIKNIDGIKKTLSEKTGTDGFFVTVITGLFSKITVRSLKKNEKPYPTLEKAAEQQYTYMFTDIEGTAVGFYCPAVTGESTLNDWHLHFISSDRKHGGHILEAAVSDATAVISQKRIFTILRPETSK